MKIPPAGYGALGGAVAASIFWIALSPQRPDPVASPPTTDENPASTTARDSRHPVSALVSSPTQTGHQTGTTPQNEPATPAHLAQRLPLSFTSLPQRPAPAPQPAADLTEAQLIVRARQVEDQANTRLEALASRLDLTEEQQDRIFPILASASPSYLPILLAEGSTPTPASSTSSTSSTYGDTTSIAPGASAATVENEIFTQLDTAQQARLEETAIDREAWWEDIITQLEQDLEDSTSTAALPTGSQEETTSTPAEYSEEEREAAATTNQVDDFSSLFGN